MRRTADDVQRSPGSQNPLAVPQPEVARFNRRTIFILALVASSVLAFTLVATFTPKQKVQGQDAAGEKEKDCQVNPQLPDPLLHAPGKYSDLKNGSEQVPAGASANASPSAAPSLQQGNPPTYGVQPSAVNAAGPASAREERLKDAASAVRSPVTFSSNDPQARAEHPTATPFGPATLPPVPAGSPPSRAVSFQDDQNMQGEKRTFAGERVSDFPYIKATLLSPLSQYEVKAGTILPALLITGINSDLPGQLVAQLRENVYDTVTGNHLLMPQGSKVIGEYDSKVAFGQERVLVVWTRVIMPDGTSISLEGMPGIDLSGYAGVTGKVNNHYGKLVTSVVLGSVIGAGAQVAVGGQGAPNVPPSFGQLAVSGAATNINQAAQQHVSKVLNIQPTIEVAPGDKINVFVTKDMILRPYTE